MSAKLYKGNSPISKINFGNKVVSAIYRGPALLWQGFRVFQDWMGYNTIGEGNNVELLNRETYTMPDDAIDIEISFFATVFVIYGSAWDKRNNTFSLYVNGSVVEKTSKTAAYEQIDGNQYLCWRFNFSTIPSLKKGDVLSFSFGEATVLVPVFTMTMKLI